MISVTPACWLADYPYVAETLLLQFSQTINMITVKLCMMVVLIELYPLIPLPVPLIVFQGHSSVTIKLKRCIIVNYME